MNIKACRIIMVGLIGIILVICCINTFTIDAATPNVKVLIAGVDEEPTALKLGECTSNSYIELWHYSGGYWGYNNLKIYDKDLKYDLTNSDSLEKALNEQIEFEINIDTKLYNELKKYEDIKVFCSTTLTNKMTMENRLITDLFYDKPVIELKNNKIYFKAKPKFNFYTQNKLTFDELIGDRLNVSIPLIDPDFGYNTYAIWKRSKAEDWGGAIGFLDKNDPYAPAPEGSGLIAPVQIKNADGHLVDGFTFKTGNITRYSNEASVGFGTFRNGGAVGIHFNYPLKFTFYAGMDPNDLMAKFESLPCSAAEGDDVLVCVTVNSTFETDLANVPYKWEITDKNGNPVPATFSGSANAAEGKIEKIEAIKGESVLYAVFKMPDSDVNIKFEVNKDGQNPQEKYLDNNVIDSGELIKVAKRIETSVEQFDLDYNVLSRKVAFPLADNNDIVAELILPRSDASWNGSNATGALNVTNEAEKLFNNFNVKNNPPVNEPEEIIVRRPVINMTLNRSSFGDNPEGKKCLNWPTPWEPLSLNGNITFEGNVVRKYTYKINNRNNLPVDTGSGEAKASFNRGVKTVNVRAFIYNGSPSIAPKTFQNTIENNNANSLEKKLLWASEPYKFDVIRKMCHLNENGSVERWVDVPGQYQRIFTQQNSAKINWSIPASMAANYKRSRDAARKMDTRNSELDRAVFASDKAFQDLAYPIKSGYYFNPTGTYQFTVETVTYKPTTADTEEHKNLVQALINSFRYESNLVYVNNKNQAVDIQNQSATKKGTVYTARAAAITAADPVGLNGVNWLQIIDRKADPSRYTKTVEEIRHSTDEDISKTHEFWRNILEGYEESGTLSSYNNYKYREYVKPGQTMYRITEKTTVTIIVNPQNIKAYTHIQMADGKYYVRAYFADSALANISSALPTLKSVQIDNIEISVVGSRYSDMNFDER